jgi:hypothetical protein
MLQTDVLVVENEQEVFSAMIALKKTGLASPMLPSQRSARKWVVPAP